MRYLILSFSILCGLNSCVPRQDFIANNDFLLRLDSYLSYVDSTMEYRANFDYIRLESSTHNDTTDFIIYLNGGSYDFIVERDRIKDFVSYKNYHILFVGDYPNEIVKISQNKRLNINEDIVKKYYINDYLKYQKDPSSVGPLIYDYMAIYLTYKKDKLISIKRQYY